jgi:predicted lipid-binding transport protein (Tim44 family)
MIDVLFFSILAIFVILRLKKILGNEQTEESPKKVDKNQSISRFQKYSKIIKINTKAEKDFSKKQEINSPDLQQQFSYDEISIKKKRQFDHDSVRSEILSINPNEKEEVIENVISLCKKYPFFSYKTLISGFQMINEQVIKSYSSQSHKDLLVILNDDTFDKFSKAIEENESHDILEKIEILRFEELEIKEIKTKNKNTDVVFNLSTKQLQYKIAKSDGLVVSGSKSSPVSRKEEWTISDAGDCLNWKVTKVKLLGSF